MGFFSRIVPEEKVITIFILGSCSERSLASTLPFFDNSYPQAEKLLFPQDPGTDRTRLRTRFPDYQTYFCERLIEKIRLVRNFRKEQIDLLIVFFSNEKIGTPLNLFVSFLVNPKNTLICDDSGPCFFWSIFDLKTMAAHFKTVKHICKTIGVSLQSAAQFLPFVIFRLVMFPFIVVFLFISVLRTLRSNTKSLFEK